MKEKSFLRLFVMTSLGFSAMGVLGCSQNNVSASGTQMDREAQKAADRFAAVEFIKCGEYSYSTNGSDVWQLKDLKVMAVSKDSDAPPEYKAEQARKGIDWHGSIHFDCSSGRLYNRYGGHADWARECGLSSVGLMHQKGEWLYSNPRKTLEEWQAMKKFGKQITCENVPR